MRVEFRPLTKDEKQSAVHFCGRCDTWQKRFELHHCTPTERWKAAKAAMRVARQEPETPVDAVDSVSTEPANNERDAANTSPAVSTEPANIFAPANSDAQPQKTDRKEYMRELMRRKRAEAKMATHG